MGDENHFERSTNLKELLASFKRAKKGVAGEKLKEHAKALEGIPQGGLETAQDAAAIVRHLVRLDVHRASDKATRLAAAACFCHLLRLQVCGPDEEAGLQLDQHEQEELYKCLIWSLTFLKPGAAHFDMAKGVLDYMAAGQLFVGLLDLNADNLVRDVFKTLFQMMTNASAAEIGGESLNVMASLLENADSVPRSVVELVAKHLSVAADKGQAPYKLACKLVERAEDALSFPLQTFIRDSVAFDSAFADHANAHNLRNLLSNLHLAAPSIVLATLPPLASELASENAREAVAAVDLLSLLFSLPGAALASQEGAAFDKLLAIVDHPVADARSKLAAALPRIIASCPTSETRERAAAACVGRLMDPDPAVRLVAVRSTGEALLSDSVPVTSDTALALLGRLKDTTEPVRLQAMKSAVRVYQHVAKSAALAAAAQGPSALAAPWSPAERLASDLLAGVVEYVFRASLQEKSRGLVPDLLPSSALIPVTGDPRADARLGLLALAGPDAQAHECLSRVLLGQQRLRVLLGELVSCRGALARASPTKKAPLRQQVEAVVDAVVKMCGGDGLRSALLALTEQKDNHIFTCMRQLCQPHPPGTTGPPQTEVVHRGRLPSSQPSQRSQPDAPPVSPAEAAAAEAEARLELLKDVQQRLRAASKDVLSLLKFASMTVVSPRHVQALFTALEDASGSGEDLSQEFLTTLRQALNVVADSAPLLASRMAPALLKGVQSESMVVCAAALELAAGVGRAIEAPRLSQASCNEVVARLEDIAMSGPCKSAGHAVRCVALLPQQAQLPALERLYDRLLAALLAPGAADDINAVNVAHGIAQLIRLAPDVAAPSASKLVEFVFEGVCKSGALFGSLDGPSTATVSKHPKKGEAWAAIGPSLLHKRAAMTALAKALVHGLDRARGPSAAMLQEALEIACGQLEVFLDLDTDLLQFGAETPFQGGFLRLAAASALLDVALTSHDRVVSIPAFCTLAYTMQDPILEVRRGFRMKLQKELLRLLRASGAAPLSRVSKYAAILCLAAPDPSEQNRRDALGALVSVLDAFRAATPPPSAPNAEVSAAGGGGGSNLLNCPEYAVFFALYVLGHHEDFPTPAELADEAAAAAEGAAAPLDALLDPFQRMLRFLLQPLITLSADPPSSLALVKTICRVARVCRDADAQDDCTASMALLADIAVAVAVDAAGADVAQHAAAHQTPRGCCMPSRLFKRRENGDEGQLRHSRRGSLLPDRFRLLPPCPLVTEGIEAAKQRHAPAPVASKRAGRAAKASKPRTKGAAAGKAAAKKRGADEPPATPKRGTRQLAIDRDGSAHVADAHSPAPARKRGRLPSEALFPGSPQKKRAKRAAVDRSASPAPMSHQEGDDDEADERNEPPPSRQAAKAGAARAPARKASGGKPAAVQVPDRDGEGHRTSPSVAQRRSPRKVAPVSYVAERVIGQQADEDEQASPSSPGSYENDEPDFVPDKPRKRRKGDVKDTRGRKSGSNRPARGTAKGKEGANAHDSE